MIVKISWKPFRWRNLMDLIRFEQVSKDYPLGQVVVPALKGIDLSIQEGEFLAIAGPSGSGKTTLLNLIGCVDTATSGKVVVDGKDTAVLSDEALTRLRLHTLGFIFQTFNLIPVLDVYDNVEFPLLLKGGMDKAQRRERVMTYLEKVGLASHMKHRPGELSGGQRQRVAIARALVSHPKVVLADEPTANLDSETGASILELMKHMNEAEGTTFIFSTHDHAILRQARRVVRLLDGKVVPEAA
jgi:putative ABC transport system ATP-binding protein